jgi:hypothetical protein
MKKLTKDSVAAFLSAKKFKRGNTSVEVLPNVTILKLHGNPIAYKYNDPEGTISVQNCGWFSNTTKERLNALPNVEIKQKNWNWYLNGSKWDGNLIEVAG